MIEADYRSLPAVDRVLAEGRISAITGEYPRTLMVDLVREILEQGRQSISKGKTAPSLQEIVDTVIVRLREIMTPGLQSVINASGVILHTNLGRAALSVEASTAMADIAAAYCNLEFEMARGVRGSRNDLLEPLICRLTGAEAALVVNNNAAAVMLMLSGLARRKEVIVSRGQAVEIGGGFRIPDVMRQSGAKLVEVGTTNCTYGHDYKQAITDRTAALLRVHPSNFRVEGFVNEVTLAEMISIGNEYDIPVLDDLGSGCLLDTSTFGLCYEPRVQDSIAAGAAIATFSGDKLIGGPQAGILIGQKRYIDRLRKHPLARALRIDKMTIAGLTYTLFHYLKEEATSKVPVWRMIAASLDDIERRAYRWVEPLGDIARVTGGRTMLGGGSLPGTSIETRLVAVDSIGTGRRNLTAAKLNQKLRLAQPPVIGRVGEETLYLDPRTVLPEDDARVIEVLKNIAAELT